MHRGETRGASELRGDAAEPALLQQEPPQAPEPAELRREEPAELVAGEVERLERAAGGELPRDAAAEPVPAHR